MFFMGVLCLVLVLPGVLSSFVIILLREGVREGERERVGGERREREFVVLL